MSLKYLVLTHWISFIWIFTTILPTHGETRYNIMW